MPRQNKILIRQGTTAPSAGDFDTAEPAWDATNGKLYIKDGAGNMVEVGAGGGGGGLTYFTEAESTTSPNDTVSVDSLTAAAATTDADVALVAKGAGATLAQVPDGATAGGDKRGIYATDLQKSRAFRDDVASGAYSVIAGGRNNMASGAYSSALSGQSNIASSNYSFVGGGNLNEAKTNIYATAVGGNSNDATGQYSFVGGGQSNTASGLYSVVCGGGGGNTANASYAITVGGYGSRATGQYSFIAGGAQGTTRGITGNHVFPACKEPIAAAQGVTQSGLLLLGRETTDATATVLASNSSAAGTTNQVILPNNSAYSFTGEVIAGVTAAGDTARWTIDGAIKRGANAASTAMVGTPTVTMTHNDAGAAAWTVAVTADTTNGGIKVEVTGAAATTIRWVCKINTTEMTY